VERILDLGCGTGGSGGAFGLDAENWCIIGIDIQSERARIAHIRNKSRGWRDVCAQEIPFSGVSLTAYSVKWPCLTWTFSRTLAELHRVLVPGGWLRVTLHSPRSTWQEFQRSFPKPKQSLYRDFVFLNGVILQFTGKVVSLGKVAESCQTEGGMRIALRTAGFEAVTFRREGLRFFLEARRDRSVHPVQVLESRVPRKAASGGRTGSSTRIPQRCLVEILTPILVGGASLSRLFPDNQAA